MPLPAWLPVWLTNLLGGGWIRNALGVRKDLIDTKKSKLEVKKLEHEERARHSLITPATFDDVKEFDPKYRAIKRRIRKKASPPPLSTSTPTPTWKRVIEIIFWLFILLSILTFSTKLVVRLLR